MKLNAGVITSRLEESKDFYTRILGFGTIFENDFYLLMHTPNKQSEISFMLPNHPTQDPFFHKPFRSEGLFITIEVDDVDSLYKKIKEKGVEIKVDLRDEPWGDRHFSIEDPSGVKIDLVRYQPSAEQ